jgi:hypothetical protein
LLQLTLARSGERIRIVADQLPNGGNDFAALAARRRQQHDACAPIDELTDKRTGRDGLVVWVCMSEQNDGCLR